MLTKRLRATSHTLLSRFTFRVLVPAFLLLLVLSGGVFWLYSHTQREQALGELDTAADTTAIRLEREIALRRTGLTTTGTEIFQLKRDYKEQRSQLRSQREQCRQSYRGDDVSEEEQAEACSPFTEQLSALPPGSRDQLKAIEEGYAKRAKALNQDEAEEIDQRLEAFSNFFPETLALMVVDDNGKLISRARAETDSQDPDVPFDALRTFAREAREMPIRGTIPDDHSRQAVFAYPINNGAVLASFDLDHASFLRPSIQNAPLDHDASQVLIAHDGEDVLYPVTSGSPLQDVQEPITSKTFRFADQGTIHTGVSSHIDNADWHVIATSPRALVLAPLRDAQIIAFILLGGMLVILLWVGTIYIRRLTWSVRRLVTGARAFSAGNLEHRIELGDTNTEFQQLAEAMNDMAARIAEAEEEIDRRNKEFINIATHELKTPMSGIIGSLSTALEHKRSSRLDKKTSTLLDNAYQETTRLRDMVDDLLDIARLEGGEVTFQWERLDIGDSIHEVLETLAPAAEKKNIALHYEPDETPPPVSADATKLRVILTNFISNAIKYNYENGSVDISHTLRKDLLVTHISDEGFGIPMDQQSNVFEKFYRVDSQDHKRVSGTGLGLYTTKQYVEGMGGAAWFQSEPDQGTTFSFSVPLANDTTT